MSENSQSFSLESLEQDLDATKLMGGVSKEFLALTQGLGIQEDDPIEVISTKKIDIQYCINYTILRMALAVESGRLQSYTNLISFMKSLLIAFDTRKELNTRFDALEKSRARLIEGVKSVEGRRLLLEKSEWEYQHFRFQLVSNFMAEKGLTFQMSLKKPS